MKVFRETLCSDRCGMHDKYSHITAYFVIDTLKSTFFLSVCLSVFFSKVNQIPL